MKIDIDKLNQLVVEGDKILFTAEGEAVLLELFKIQDQVEEAFKAVKLKIAETALKQDPNFTSIQGAKIKVFYRSYGSKYKIDASLVDQVPKELYEVKVSYSAKSKEIDNYAEEHGGVPYGIIETEREKQISITQKDKEVKDEQV